MCMFLFIEYSTMSLRLKWLHKQRCKYYNLIINYFVTNFIKKIFKEILKQKQAKNQQKIFFQKQQIYHFDTFLLYKYSIYEYFHSYLYFMCVIQKREIYSPEVTRKVASMVLAMANASSIIVNIRPPSPKLRPNTLRPSDFWKRET